MSVQVLDSLGLNKSTQRSTCQSSNIVEAYLLLEGINLHCTITNEAIKIEDFLWRFSIWDSSEARLTYDIIEGFDEASEKREEQKLYVLELLTENPVHMIIEVCHSLTGMPFASGSCTLSEDHDLHEMELVLTTSTHAGISGDEVEFTFHTAYAITSDTLDLSKWAGTVYEIKPSSTVPPGVKLYEYQIFPSGRELEVSLSTDVYDTALDIDVKATRTKRHITVSPGPRSEAYYATVSDMHLTEDMHQAFDQYKLCVTARLTPRLKKGNAFIEEVTQHASFLGDVINAEASWSKDTQLGPPLPELTTSFVLDVYVLAVPVDVSLEHEVIEQPQPHPAPLIMFKYDVFMTKSIHIR